MITQELIRELFNYRDGNLYWKISRGNKKINNKAGGLNKNDNRYRIKINYKIYLTHRLIFLYHYGYIPKYVDHIDNDSTNNKIENLRKVTRSENAMNKKSDKNSISKYKGVNWHKRNKMWVSQIQINGKKKYLGSFISEKAAAFIYNVYARGYFGKFANLNEL